MPILASSYAFNFITNNIQISPDSEGVTKLVPIITQGFLPSINDEIINGVPAKILKLEKNEDNVGAAILFRGDIIAIEISSDNILEPTLIEQKLTSIISSLSPFLNNLKAKRISSVINIITDNSDKAFEDKIYNSFFKDENHLFEWSVRKVSEKDIDGEQTYNLITVHKGHSIKSQNGVFQNIKTITITADNNTVPLNQLERFDFSYSSLLSKLFSKSLEDIHSIIK